MNDPALPKKSQSASTIDSQTGSAGDFRSHFFIPQLNGRDEIYLVGNSLGLQPKRTVAAVQRELENWQQLGVRGHFEGTSPWMPYHETLAQGMGRLIGAKPSEVVMMNGLTVNLHLMMATFFAPRKLRRKILIERHAFPSDVYAAKSRLQLSGLSEDENLIVMAPNHGENFSTAYICDTIDRHADELAMVLLPGVQYYTGQAFDIKAITAAAHRHGIVVGWDLAHAVGNVPLNLHDANADFAVWCTYKYLNSGPGAVAGCFVHQRHAENVDLPRMAGWWGQDKTNRFKMGDQFQPIPTAEGWQLSNPPILALAPVKASLEVFQEAGAMSSLVAKSRQLTSHLEQQINEHLAGKVNVITPTDPAQRGCQLSLEVSAELNGKRVHQLLEQTGVRTDWREPNVIRSAPVPLYNSVEDVDEFVRRLGTALEAAAN